MKSKIIAVIFGIVLLIPIFAQSQISLLDTEKVNDYLSLSSQQISKINPMIEQIKSILEEDRNIIAEIKERVNNGDEPGFFEKIGVKRGHDKRSSKIEDLTDDIEDQLTDQQKIKFNDIEKPELKELKKEDVFGNELSIPSELKLDTPANIF
ncbi:MAG: hypothetical protein IPJ23_11295 [Ignavibacteriales bacterium]|nr:hypothetical protein [Ignavibacteriales bacterium]